LLRSAPSATIDSAAGKTTAAPNPCSLRNAISWPWFRASPHPSDAAVNTARQHEDHFPEADGFRILLAVDAEEAVEALRTAPDCVLLDVMLPGASGFDLCRDIRCASDVPVLFLSARDGDADKLRGLGLGADDYIVKSVTPAEVVTRVKAVLRRSSAVRGLGRLRFGSLEVDLATHEVHVGGKLVRMTAREFELPRVFVQHPGQVFSREHLFELVWGSHGDRRAVSVYISRVRGED
jgi:DNA-binding response OmpR family regulator